MCPEKALESAFKLLTMSQYAVDNHVGIINNINNN